MNSYYGFVSNAASVGTGMAVYIVKDPSKSDFLVFLSTLRSFYECVMIIECIRLLFKYLFYYQFYRKKYIKNNTETVSYRKFTGERVKLK